MNMEPAFTTPQNMSQSPPGYAPQDVNPGYAPQGGYVAPQGGYAAPQGGYAAPQGGYAAAPVQNVVNVVTTQPVVTGNVMPNVSGHRDWNSGLCGCFNDCCGVIKACCCMECTICGINSRIGECACAHWIVPGALINARTRVRTLGGIKGSMVNDCFTMLCCMPLAICQIERELDAMGL